MTGPPEFRRPRRRRARPPTSGRGSSACTTCWSRPARRPSFRPRLSRLPIDGAVEPALGCRAAALGAALSLRPRSPLPPSSAGTWPGQPTTAPSTRHATSRCMPPRQRRKPRGPRSSSAPLTRRQLADGRHGARAAAASRAGVLRALPDPRNGKPVVPAETSTSQREDDVSLHRPVRARAIRRLGRDASLRAAVTVTAARCC